MRQKAAITVNRPPDEVQRLWLLGQSGRPTIEETEAAVTFREAPGDRGTEIHVELSREAPGGRIGELVQKVAGAQPLAKVKDELRHFKQRAETGEVPRSDGSPEGEQAERKLKQRPAQPLDDSELQKAGA
jgi:uncharacterized membrane protein